ncbi:MAG: ASCH domain-containing protein [Clostridium sp.]|uniref:ASCH domain-containing protein n=1 Tax=Clostridium sp. TaxID=1506 RepID=UPI003EE71F12
MDSLLKEYLILVGRDEEEIDYYGTWYFGDNKVLADELFDLVIKGEKTATTSLYCLYKFKNEELPKENSFSVVTNYDGNKKCLIETKKVTVLTFLEVEKEFAYKEGEGDKSLEYWQREHLRFFNRELEKYDKVFTEDMLVVCEEFECIYK